ncbi:MAG: PQQ-binding-like beta-propeller repeat protein [Treponema sp.]|jgi:outer membrane protein assembly factor BamB|nr:PQQ-binding-like beta-propeller repeat protein [Treponema sp.]
MIYRILCLLCIPFLPLSGQTPNQPGQGETEPVSTAPIWRQALGGEVTGLPAVQAQSAVVALDSGNIKAYSTQGRPLWTYYARGRITPYVTRSREGTCYISRTNGTFITVNRSGRELWRVNPGGPLSGPVIPGWDGRVFVPTGRKISCYTGSGYLLWQKKLESPISIHPILSLEGGILLVLEDGDLLHIDPFGKTFSRKLQAAPQAVLSVGSPGKPGRFLIFYKNGAAEIIDPAYPDRRPYTLPRLPGPPLAAVSRENKAAVTLKDGQVLLVSGEDGQFLWSGDSHIKTGRNIQGNRAAGEAEISMLYDERGIYVLSKSGATGFTEDGRRLWLIRLDGAAAVPAFGDDGILYSGGDDWILYAYRLEDRVRQQKQSLYGPAPLGSYGTGNPPPSPWADYYFRFNEDELDTQFTHIEKSIKAHTVGEEELAYTGYLMETARGENRPGASRLPPVQIQYRVRALGLLGILGSRETIPFLADLFNRDGEPVIKAAAADAIGKIGIDPDGIALRSFTAAIFPAGSVRDEQVLTSVAAATGALCRFSGPPLSDTGVKILTLLTGDIYPKAAQQQARRELDTLRP